MASPGSDRLTSLVDAAARLPAETIATGRYNILLCLCLPTADKSCILQVSTSLGQIMQQGFVMILVLLEQLFVVCCC